MGHIDQNVIEPMMDRFVYGLFYPAILGTNLVLLLERTQTEYNGGNVLIWSDGVLQIAWALTLLIFIFDFVSTAPYPNGKEPSLKSPPKTFTLGLIDMLAALLFFFAQASIVSSKTANHVDWHLLWYCLLALHSLYIAWYIIRIKQASENIKTYKRCHEYLRVQLYVVISQLTFVLFISYAFWPVNDSLFIGVICLSILGWVARQAIEYEYFS